MPPSDPYEMRMSLSDHLEELRKRLILGLIGPLIAGAVAMLFGRTIMAWLAQPLLYELAANDLPATLYPTRIPESFGLFVKVSLITGLIVGIPWLLYQAWMFIVPGLYRHEKKFVLSMLPGSALLSAAGVAFMYYVILPVTVSFMIFWTLTYPMPEMQGTWVQDRLVGRAANDATVVAEPDPPAHAPIRNIDPVDPPEGSFWINVPDRAFRYVVDGRVYQLRGTRGDRMATPWFTMSEYVSFCLWMGLATALAFQLPLVMLLLGWTGLVDRHQFARGRKYAMLGCVMVGALLTPPDPMSQVALALPMYLLYELGLLLMRLLIKPAKLRFEDEDAAV